MELIENIISAISPRIGAERRIWQLKASRLYDAARPSVYHRKPGAQGSANKSMDQARHKVRDWARHLDENHDLAIGVLDELVNKIVGAGITLEPLAASSTGRLNKKLNRDISKLWRRWTRRPEVTGELSFREVQRLTCRTWFRDGEVLTQHILGNRAGLAHLGPVPYSIELIEPDFLPFEFNDPSRGIVHGIEQDVWGRPRAYHLLKQAPDNTTAFFFRQRSGDTKRVAAELISHVKFTRRLKQARGISVFHGVAHRLDDIKDYEESERIAARIAASMSAFIKKGTEFDANLYDGNKEFRQLEFTSGMIFDDLLPGEEVGTIDTNRPNTGLMEYRNSQLKAIAAGTGTNASSISKNYDGTYSAQRQELVESYPAYDRLRDYFASEQLQPTYENFINAAILSRAIVVPKSVDMTTIFDADWIAPPKSWIDPKKEIEADAAAVAAQFKTRASVIRERTGREPDVVKEQIKLELAESPPPAIPKPARLPAPEVDDDDDAPIDQDEAA